MAVHSRGVRYWFAIRRACTHSFVPRSLTHPCCSADNGYHLGNAGLALDKRQPWDYDARIPLVIRGPGVAKGAVSTVPVSHVDLVPTVLQLAGVEIPSFIDGQSLVPLLQGAGSITRAQLEARAAALADAAAEGDPAREAATAHGDDATDYALAEAEWTRQTIFYSYHGENMQMPSVCIDAGVTDPALMCYAQNNGSLTVGPYPPANFQTFCSCQDTTNNTYACLRTVNSTVNYRYCEFFVGVPSESGSGSELAVMGPGAAPVTVEYFDINSDPYEMSNQAAELAPSVAADLHARLTALRTCVGTAQCNQF